MCYGTVARGSPGASYDHSTGQGYVGEEPGCYSDTLQKGYRFVLYVGEVLGALSPSCHRLVHLRNRKARGKGALDNTDYGNRARRLRHCDTGFEVFHKRCLSASVVFGWGSTLCYGARLRRGNLHLSDSADSVSYGVHGDVAPTPFNNFNTYAGCD